LDKKKQLPASPLRRTERKSFPLLRSGASLPLQASAFGCFCKLRLKVADISFLSVRPVPLGISGYLTLTLIFLCCFDAPVISQHVFTSGHKSLSCALHTSICFLSHPLPSVSLLDLAILLPRGNTYGLPSSKYRIVVETLGTTSRPNTSEGVMNCKVSQRYLIKSSLKKKNTD